MLLILFFCFVLSTACGEQCGQHEVANAQNIRCQPTCLDVKHNRDAPPICPLNCIPNQCTCAPGFVREHSHTYCNEPHVRCIPKSQCSISAGRVKRDEEVEQTHKCPSHERYGECGRVCEKTCTSINDPNCVKRCDPAACTCKKGYVRYGNRCIKPKYCRRYGAGEPPVYGAESFAAVPLLRAMSCNSMAHLACVASCKLACRVLGPFKPICEGKCYSKVCVCNGRALLMSVPEPGGEQGTPSSAASGAEEPAVEFGIKCNSICKAGCDMSCSLLNEKMKPTCKSMCLQKVCKCKNAALLALDVANVADEDMDEDEEEEEHETRFTVLASGMCSGIKGTLCKQGCKAACSAISNTLKPVCISACLKNVCKCPVPTKALELVATGSDAEDREAEEFDETPNDVVVLSSMCSGIKGALCKAGCKLPCKKLNGVLQQTCLKLCYKNVCKCPIVARFATETDKPTSVFELLAEQPDDETETKSSDIALPPCPDDLKTTLCKSACSPACLWKQNASEAFLCNAECVGRICRCNLSPPAGVSADPAALKHTLEDNEVTAFSEYQLVPCPITENTTRCLKICQFPCNAYKDELKTMCTKMCLGQTCKCRLDQPGGTPAPTSQPEFAYLSKPTEIESYVLGTHRGGSDSSSSEEDDEEHHHGHRHGPGVELASLNTCGSGIKTKLCVQGCKLPCKLMSPPLKKVCQNVCIKNVCKCSPN